MSFCTSCFTDTSRSRSLSLSLFLALRCVSNESHVVLLAVMFHSSALMPPPIVWNGCIGLNSLIFATDSRFTQATHSNSFSRAIPHSEQARIEAKPHHCSALSPALVATGQRGVSAVFPKTNLELLLHKHSDYLFRFNTARSLVPKSKHLVLTTISISPASCRMPLHIYNDPPHHARR